MPFAPAKRVVWQGHSTAGMIARGTEPMGAYPLDMRHFSISALLTAHLEASAWGTVQSWDGCGISASLLHFLGVNRALEQGSLWRVLLDVRHTVSAARWAAFEADVFVPNDFHFTEDAVVRHLVSGKPVAGEALRAALSGPRGFVPAQGPIFHSAKRVAEAFRDLFAAPDGRSAQWAAAIRWLAVGNAAEERLVYERFAGNAVPPIAMLAGQLPPAVHLAMAFYHSFSANGPSPAAKILRAAYRAGGTPERFATKVIRGLGLSSYGRWHDDLDDKGSRYDSTRRVVWGMPHLFDGDLARRLIPRNL